MRSDDVQLLGLLGSASHYDILNTSRTYSSGRISLL